MNGRTRMKEKGRKRRREEDEKEIKELTKKLWGKKG